MIRQGPHNTNTSMIGGLDPGTRHKRTMPFCLFAPRIALPLEGGSVIQSRHVIDKASERDRSKEPIRG
jgi:hypothetical protein